MTVTTRALLTSPRLRQLVARGPIDVARRAFTDPAEVCELCTARVPREHRHLIDLDTRELVCACRACALLFDRTAAGNGHLRLVPSRRLVLEDFVMADELWERLRIPVEIAFFFAGSRAGRVMAYYPSPLGPTESHLTLEAWRELECANPVLTTMEHDVEALLVNRARGARRQWLVPIEDPYRLVAVIRTTWRGLTGGSEVWQRLDAFFDDLDRRGVSRTKEWT
jgi:Family of unknown function (DUF5947)